MLINEEGQLEKYVLADSSKKLKKPGGGGGGLSDKDGLHAYTFHHLFPVQQELS